MTFEEDKAITLNDTLAKYMYLDIYVDLSGKYSILTFPETFCKGLLESFRS